MSEFSDKGDLVFFYKLCKFETGEPDGCFFSDEELDPMNSSAAELSVAKIESVDSSAGSKLTSYEYKASISHEEGSCVGGSVCKYVFAFANPQDLQGPRQATLQVDLKSGKFEDIDPAKSVFGALDMGEYRHYRLSADKFDIKYVSKIVIELRSYLGDADLYVAT